MMNFIHDEKSFFITLSLIDDPEESASHPSPLPEECPKYTQNVNRANVMARDASFVLSYTLGLVSTRHGVVVVSG